MGTLDGKVEADVNIEESVQGLANVLMVEMGCGEHRFLDWKGESLPW